MADPGVVAVVRAAGGNARRDDLARLAALLGWDEAGRGAFGRVIPEGARVVVKPNLVLHENQGVGGLEPLVTDPELIRAVAEEALRAGASSVVVGDAPIQGCDFERLLAATGLDAWAAETQARDPRFTGVVDFRRTTCTFVDGVRVAMEELQPEERFVLLDLGSSSLLEPVTDDGGMGRFRVTCYDPRLMRATHAHGRHRYLVARDLLEADVVINLPKLKTHKKAGITCALKNLVGINGNKEFLPHHRVGSAAQGGDCYEQSSVLRRSIEYALDRQNMTSSRAAARAIHTATRQLHRIARLARHDSDTEGSWSGNDTVWRMCLDLNRILLYAAPDASMGDEVRRRVIHVVDGDVAGQGNGPLAPEPFDLGLLVAGGNAAAVDWVAASLLDYDPRAISLTRGAFGGFRWPLTSFAPEEIRLLGDLGSGLSAAVLDELTAVPVRHPVGWRSAARTGLGDRELVSAGTSDESIPE
jgi:uncharacterized protein (DUF362 family)